MQANAPSPIAARDDEADDLLSDETFDAARARKAAPEVAPERVRTRRGGPRAPLPLLPLIALCAGVGVAYVAQTAHITQTSYQQTQLAAQQVDLASQARQLGDDLARLRSPERIDTAARRLGLIPPKKWAYVAAVPAPIAVPQIAADPANPAPTQAPPDHVVQAMVGSVGDGPGAVVGGTGSR